MQFDRVSFATATTGTGTVTAGAATSGFRTMAGAAIPDGASVTYAIEDGAAWETGTGVVGDTATTLTRVLSQSSTGALLVLSGAAKCFITPIAADYNALGGGGLGGLTTITIPDNALEWTETVTATGVTPASRVMLGLAPANDTDENDPLMLSANRMIAVAGTDQITISMAFATKERGPIKLHWSAL